MIKVNIWSDGGCRGNGSENNIGAYGVVLECGANRKELSGSAINTSNNQMELMGAIIGLETLRVPCEVILTTDSNYVVQGMTSWIKGWKAKGWKNSKKEPVKNKELWERLDLACMRHNVTFKWVKGHNNHPENERCDTLANIEMDKMEVK